MTTRRNRGLTPEQRTDARLALQMLNGTGMSLVDAARIASQGQHIAQVPLSKAIAMFLRECTRKNLRPRSVEFYELRLDHFACAFEDDALASLDRPALRAWLEGLDVAETTRQGYLRAIRAFLRWCKRQEPPIIRTDPTEGLQLLKPRIERKIDHFDVDQSRAMLSAPSPYRDAIALMLFAGIRPSEINAREKPPLLWKHIDAKRKLIRIPAEIAKTRAPRVLENLPPALWKWIAPKQPGDPVCDRQLMLMPRWMQQHGIINDWIQDGCRHSFATYHLAAYNNANLTSTILGHEGRVSLLHQVYAGIVTQKEARQFFAITP